MIQHSSNRLSALLFLLSVNLFVGETANPVPKTHGDQATNGRPALEVRVSQLIRSLPFAMEYVQDPVEMQVQVKAQEPLRVDDRRPQGQTAASGEQFSVEYLEDEDTTRMEAGMLVKDTSGQILKFDVAGTRKGRSGTGKQQTIYWLIEAAPGDFLVRTPQVWFILDGTRLSAGINIVGETGRMVGMVDNSSLERSPAYLANIGRARVAEVECGKFHFRLSREQQNAIQKVIDYFEGKDSNSRLRSSSETPGTPEVAAGESGATRSEQEIRSSISPSSQPVSDPVPPLDGTTWKGLTNRQEPVSLKFILGGALEYTFVFHCPTEGGGEFHMKLPGTWKQDGSQVHMSIQPWSAGHDRLSGERSSAYLYAGKRFFLGPEGRCEECQDRIGEPAHCPIFQGDQLEATIEAGYLRGASYIKRLVGSDEKARDPKTGELIRFPKTGEPVPAYLYPKPESMPYAEWTLVKEEAKAPGGRKRRPRQRKP